MGYMGLHLIPSCAQALNWLQDNARFFCLHTHLRERVHSSFWSSIGFAAMMDVLLADKIALLRLYFPSYEETILTDLLGACKGDVQATRSLILGRASKEEVEPETRKRESSVLYQGLLDPLEETSNKKIKVSSDARRSQIINLYTPAQVRQHLYPYASFYKSFLPAPLAASLLAYLLTETDKLYTNEFYLFENKCTSNHNVGAYYRSEETASQLKELFYNGNRVRTDRFYNEDMAKAAAYIKEFMNRKVIRKYPRLPFQSLEPWTSDVCIVNYYHQLSNNLAWHSDRLNHIGPHNYICSMSLGSTRTFRLRSTYKKHAPIYQIHVPHNTLLIMHPGCQEEFKHCVNPLLKSLQLHPSAGSARFNLTYRHYSPRFINNVPSCECGIAMVLRRSFRKVEARGRYFWSCEKSYSDGVGCSAFHWADFNNYESHFVAESGKDVAIWYPDSDKEKVEYEKTTKAAEEEHRKKEGSFKE